MLHRGWPALRRCYPATPLLPTPLQVELTVLPSGAVDAASVSGGVASRAASETAPTDGAAQAEQKACAVSALRELRFARFVGSTFVRLSYTLRAHGR